MDNINLQQVSKSTQWGPRLRAWPLTGKVWVTMIIVMMSFGLIVALGQIVVHDIVPTFQDGGKHLSMNHGNPYFSCQRPGTQTRSPLNGLRDLL
jgi:hypothetical protein